MKSAMCARLVRFALLLLWWSQPTAQLINQHVAQPGPRQIVEFGNQRFNRQGAGQHLHDGFDIGAFVNRAGQSRGFERCLDCARAHRSVEPG